MRHLLRLLTRLLVLVSLALASMPVGATEVVCVTGPHEVAVPLATCGMPCCAHGAMNRATCDNPKQTSQGVLPPCCAGKHLKAAQRSSSTCIVGGKSCRCETRVTASTPSVGVAVRAATITLQQLPATLPEAAIVPATGTAKAAPGIFGTDSGPPPEVRHSPEQSRAPPVA